MAVGDVVSGITSVAASGALDFQPASGVEVVITSLGCATKDWGAGVAPWAGLFDGSLNAIQTASGSGGTLNNQYMNVKLFLNNTRYLRMTNSATGAVNFSYSGVQMK